MTATEIRHQARAEHGHIRGRLAQLEALATRVAHGGGEADVRALERQVEALRQALREHLGWEDRELPAALGDADAWGEERAARLRSSHRELRAVLGFCRDSCDGALHPVVLAQRARDLVALLRSGLGDEEHAALHADVLREDVVAIGQVTG